MNKIEDILIINTGGTFNKVYNELNGKLEMASNSDLLISKLKKCKITIPIREIIFKDSLEFVDSDREFLYRTIKEAKQKNIIVIHGTDTIDKSAKYIDNRYEGFEEAKQVCFTGSMIPISIDGIEGMSNLLSSITLLSSINIGGVFISMHGISDFYHKIEKNRKEGIFKLKKER